MFDREKNSKERIKFIKFWVDYMRKNKDWSKQHSDFVNSVLKSANQDPKLYMKVKKITKKAV
jgi:hypothetical protein